MLLKSHKNTGLNKNNHTNSTFHLIAQVGFANNTSNIPRPADTQGFEA